VLSGCELKGSVVSSLEADGSFMFVLTDDLHSDEVYDKLQQALKSVVTCYLNIVS